MYENERIEKRQNWVMVGFGLIVSIAAVGMLFFVRKKFALLRKALLRKTQALARVEKTTSDKPLRIDIIEWERYRINAAKFHETAIYSEIMELAEQSPGRRAHVLPLARQEVLERELTVSFAHFAVRLQSDYPSLTAGDVKLCCLSLAGLSTWARALCFGSTETNIIRQRKHKIKQKIDGSLFEFIFD
jgi:hypothetical protein